MQEPNAKNMKVSLYVAGDAPTSLAARQALEPLLEQLQDVSVDYELVDVLLHPERALRAGLLATPTLIVDADGRSRRFVGDLANRDDFAEAIKAYCGHQGPAGHAQS